MFLFNLYPYILFFKINNIATYFCSGKSQSFRLSVELLLLILLSILYSYQRKSKPTNYKVTFLPLRRGLTVSYR